MPANLRVVTYNIHKGIGGKDRVYRIERIQRVLDNLQPDIALLQEVDEGVPRSHRDRQVELLADALGMPYQAYQKNVHLKQGHYGNAILSRFPLGSIEHIDLTVRPKKRRRALLARCRIDVGKHDRSLLVYSLHLGLAGLERKIQLKRLLATHQIAKASGRIPIVIGGDFNDVYGNLGRRVMCPQGFSSAGKTIRTFPAILPVRPLDRIFFRGPLQLLHAYAKRTELAKQASDHLPLVADFKLA